MLFPNQFNQHTLRFEAFMSDSRRSLGSGCEMDWGMGTSPFGEVCVLWSPAGLHELFFGDAEASLVLDQNWGGHRLRRNQSQAEALVRQIFLEKNRQFTLCPRGAAFQLQVWQALLTVPSGQVSTYAAIAAQINRPKAYRAVGTAAGKNPLSVLIPCHRVLQSGGGLGGYHWGIDKKRALLAAEKAA